MKKLLLILGIVLFTSLQTMAVKQPHIVKPLADNVSLRPLVVWTPIEDADSYSVKLKEINTATGISTTLEMTSIAAPTTSYRPAATLTAGNFYTIIIRAIDGAEQSDKEKLYFQVKQKFIDITHTDLESLANENSGSDEGYIRAFFGFFGSTDALVAAWTGCTAFILPDDAIITGVQSFYVDNSGDDSSFVINRFSDTDGLGTADPIATANSTGADSVIRSTVSSDLDTSKATIDNDTYRYELDFTLALLHIFIKLRIYYID